MDNESFEILSPFQKPIVEADTESCLVETNIFQSIIIQIIVYND